MSALKNAARFVYRHFPELPIKKSLAAICYGILYRADLKACTFQKGIFSVVTQEGIEIKSKKDFDPEPLIGDLCRKELDPESVVMDFGGNIGVVACFLSKKIGPKGQVYTYEPDSTNYQTLLNNLELNTCTNCVAVQKGLWDTNTSLTFYAGGNYTSSFLETDYVHQDLQHYQKVIIPVVRLDDEAHRLGIQRLDFIKMDIEGSEIKALQGGRKTLAQFHPEMLIETHWVNGASTANEVIDILKSLDYQMIQVSGDIKMPTVTARYR